MLPFSQGQKPAEQEDRMVGVLFLAFPSLPTLWLLFGVPLGPPWWLRQ